MKELKKTLTNFISTLFVPAFCALIASFACTPAYNTIAWAYNLPQFGYWHIALFIYACRLFYKVVVGVVEE